MDCLYQDGAGGWHLIDYKTNKVTQENVAETATEHYEMQMLLYGLAMETIWGVAPVELVLHFLEIGFEWTLEWNAGARQRAIEQVNDALERLKNAYKTPFLGPSAPE